MLPHTPEAEEILAAAALQGNVDWLDLEEAKEYVSPKPNLQLDAILQSDCEAEAQRLILLTKRLVSKELYMTTEILSY